MGGDHGPCVVVPAALDSLDRNPLLRLILVGDESVLREELKRRGVRESERLTVHHAPERVEMDDSPAKVLRGKRNSSMHLAIGLVRDGKADACVSAGNTGALMAIARLLLKTIPGIDRPAIIGIVPSMHGHTHVLDLGANVDCTAKHLYQFAVMGYELVRAVENQDRPKLGLLNIGEEEIKGNEQVKQAAKLLSGSYLNFIGYVEGNDLYTSDVDIVVTDGFVGNVALKTSEGLARLIGDSLKQAYQRNLFTMLAGIISAPVLAAFRKRFDPRQYNGASFLGLRGIVVKSHGNADRVAFLNAIQIAELEVEKRVPERIGQRIESIFADQSAGSGLAREAPEEGRAGIARHERSMV
jgi:glycerol-3-phosphate acyltransferase PlsX